MFELDVSSTEGLRWALEAVDQAPGGWESALGAEVLQRVAEAVPRRVGRSQIRELEHRGVWSGPDEVVAALVAVVVEMVVMRPQALAGSGGRDAWAVLVKTAVWSVAGEVERDRQHGLGGDDAHPFRMRGRIRFIEGDVLDLPTVEVAQPVQGVDVDRRRWWVGREDFGPALLGLVDQLLAAGVPGRLAVEATARVVEIAASERPRMRHRVARQDAQGDGVLSRLGVGVDAAGAWMSLVTGSRRAGPASAVVWCLANEVDPDERIMRLQGQWLKCVAAGCGVSCEMDLSEPAARAPELQGQLDLFPEEWCQPAA